MGFGVVVISLMVYSVRVYHVIRNRNLIHIFSQLAAVRRVQSFRLFLKHVNDADGQIAH